MGCHKVDSSYWIGECSCRRNPPPHKSGPEAAHFPTHHYTFESNKKRFQAPPEYPQPPRDMWYQIPESTPAPESPPKPIFPWEKGPARPTATRVFSDDYPPSPVQTAAVPVRWEDSSGGMERYIRNIMSSAPPAQQGRVETRPPVAAVERPEPLVFSGMPAVDDRPSLPVTPAPIMTNTFWGESGDGGGVAVEGALKTAEWVCPKCGFLSANPAVFIPSHAEPAGPVAPASLPAAVDAASPPEPPQQGEPEASATAVSSPPAAVAEAEPAVAVAAAPPPQPLAPPAWLTAAIAEPEDADVDDGQPLDPSKQN
jgi:glycogenin glucosyltransferase